MGMNNKQVKIDDKMLYPEEREKWAKDNFGMTFEQWQEQNPPPDKDELDELFKNAKYKT